MFWLVGTMVVAIIANNRARSGFGWFLLSILISPLFAGILVLALGHVKSNLPVPAQQKGTRNERACPHCAETILNAAKVCKHCGRDVGSIES